MIPEPGYLIDASALLALIHREPGAERVASLLPESAISAVNLAEVIAKLGLQSAPPGLTLKMLALLALPVLPWDEASAHASLRYAHLAKSGLALGDRACITEAMRRTGTRMVTADRAWAGIEEIKDRVVLIR